MPFLTYQITPSEAVRNAGRLLKDGGAAAVKVEGGQSVVEVVRRLVDVGIPVMGHLGVLPQSVNQQSGYRQRGRDPLEAERILNDALALQEAGAFAVVLEAIPPELAAKITASLEVPTVGIGAGPDCDGQVLVVSDLLGLHDRCPRSRRNTRILPMSSSTQCALSSGRRRTATIICQVLEKIETNAPDLRDACD